MNGSNGKNGASNGHATAVTPLVGGYWLPTGVAAAYSFQLYRWHNEMRAVRAAGGDPFKETAIWPAVLATLLYLAALWLGKRVMSRRQPFDCSKYMLVYNVYQVLINVWCVAEFAREISGHGDGRNMRFWGNRYDQSMAGFKIGFLVWIHYNNKYVELLDTLWMVLRKKDRQVSFLHVYHHGLMIWAWLYVCKLECGGDAWFGAAVNSAVHVVMYAYYLLAQLRVACPWKRYLTLVQMTQFCVCMVHAAYVLVMRNAPAGLALAQAFVMLNMLVLFWKFYSASYSDKREMKEA